MEAVTVTTLPPPFVSFGKMARLSRPITITEKIDGTNASILITEDGDLFAGSRTRWITPKDDNYGFAGWAYGNKAELLRLGPGHHFGEWWGQKIQRAYAMNQKVFSLFNVHKWGDPAVRPVCCDVVPTLYTGEFNDFAIEVSLKNLETVGSFAAAGFMKPEGIVIYHHALGGYFKKTLEDDEKPKGLAVAVAA